LEEVKHILSNGGLMVVYLGRKQKKITINKSKGSPTFTLAPPPSRQTPDLRKAETYGGCFSLRIFVWSSDVNALTPPTRYTLYLKMYVYMNNICNHVH